MTTREEMRSLAEEIVGSYTNRMATIAELRETVKIDLKGFQDSRTAMAREVRTDLSRDTANRKHEVGVMLDGFGQALAAMGKETRADLAKGVADRKREVGGMLKELGSVRFAMNKELKADLAKGVADRKHEVGVMLDGFGQAHAAMSKEMRAELTKGERERQSEAREFMGELGKAVAEGKAATQALLRDFGEVQAGARDEWQKLTATMSSKRGGVALAVKPPVEEIAEEEVAKEEVAEITPELADIRDRVFEYLANHPDGSKMTELEQEFGLARIQMARIIRSLMDENKVNKQDLLYFAI